MVLLPPTDPIHPGSGSAGETYGPMGPSASSPHSPDQQLQQDLAVLQPPQNAADEQALLDQRLETRRLQNVKINPVVNNDRGWAGRLLDVGRQAVISAGQAYDSGRGTPSERLLGAIGAAGAGGLYGGFHPEVDEERQRLYDIGQSQQKEQELEGRLNRDLERRYLQARIDDIPIDSELKRTQIENAAKSRAMTEFSRRRKYDPGNPLDRELATRAGFDTSQLVAFDDSKPNITKIGNDIFQYKNGAWTPAGVKRSDLVNLDVIMPDGERRRYEIPADKAAFYSTTMSVAGANILSRERIATASNALSRDRFDLARQQFTFAKQKHEEAVKLGRAEDARNWAAKMTEMLSMVESDTDLSPEQADMLRGIIGNLANINVAGQ